MEDKEKSVIWGVVCVIYALFFILVVYLGVGITLPSILLIIVHIPLLAVGLVGLMLKKYWKIERLALVLTIVFFIVILFIAPILGE